MNTILLILTLEAVVCERCYAITERKPLNFEIIDNTVQVVAETQDLIRNVNFPESVRSAVLKRIQAEKDSADSIDGNKRRNLQTYVQKIIQTLLATIKEIPLNLQPEIDNIQNNLKSESLIEIQRNMQDIYAEAANLPELVLQMREKWSNSVLDLETTIGTQWYVWAGQQIKLVANDTLNDLKSTEAAALMLRTYIEKYSEELSSCSIEIKFELQLYNGQIQDVIEMYQPVLDHLIEQVQSCLESVDSDDAAREKCARTAFTTLDQLKNAKPDFLLLTQECDKLMSASYKQHACVQHVLRAFELEQYAVKQNIKKLLAKFKEEQDDDVEHSKRKAAVNDFDTFDEEFLAYGLISHDSKENSAEVDQKRHAFNIYVDATEERNNDFNKD